MVERVVEVPREIIVDKEVVLEKIVEVPVVNKIIKPVPTEKIVDVFKEVIVDRIVEVPEEEFRPVDVPINTTAGVVTVNERRTNMEVNTRIRKSHLNPRQIAEFEATSRQLADVTAENEAIKAQITALRERLALTPAERIIAAQQHQSHLYSEIQRLRDVLLKQTRDRDILRVENAKPQEVELQENVDTAPADGLIRDIELVRAKNLQLRDYLENVRRVAHKNAVSRAEAHRPKHAMSLATTSQIKVSNAAAAGHYAGHVATAAVTRLSASPVAAATTRHVSSHLASAGITETVTHHAAAHGSLAHGHASVTQHSIGGHGSITHHHQSGAMTHHASVSHHSGVSVRPGPGFAAVSPRGI